MRHGGPARKPASPLFGAPCVRPARPTDASQLGELHQSTWRESYAGVLPDSAVTSRARAARTAFWRHTLDRIRQGPPGDEGIVVAQAGRDATVADPAWRMYGFAWCGPPGRGTAGQPQPAPWDGEIYMLYVRAEAQRHGFGQALLVACARGLVSRGLFTAGLWTLSVNTKARSFYEAHGARLAVRRETTVSGAQVTLSGYIWEDLSGLLALAAPPPSAPPGAPPSASGGR